MPETMVRASGGFSRQNMADEKERGRLQGIAEAKVGNAEIYDVLEGKSFTNASVIGAVGNIPNKGSSNIVLGASGVQSGIPRGYYDGNGIIDATAVSNAAYSSGYSQGYANGHGDWQTVVGSNPDNTWTPGRVTSVSASYTASKAGILIIFVNATRYSSSDTEPTLSGMQIHGARRTLSGTLYRAEDKPSSAPERAFADSGIWVVEVAAGATVTWSLLIAQNAYVNYNHTLIAI